jgi:hypothetical protein
MSYRSGIDLPQIFDTDEPFKKSHREMFADRNAVAAYVVSLPPNFRGEVRRIQSR